MRRGIVDARQVEPPRCGELGTTCSEVSGERKHAEGWLSIPPVGVARDASISGASILRAVPAERSVEPRFAALSSKEDAAGPASWTRPVAFPRELASSGGGIPFALYGLQEGPGSGF